MADTPDTPTPASDTTPRRRTARKATGTKPATRRKAPSTAAKAETAVKAAATRTVTRAKTAVAAAKESATKATVAKPRAARRPAARPANRPTTKTKASGSKWGVAAIAGGLAAAGAAAAALLSLKGSSKPEKPATPEKDKGAHQPDGVDSSKSFEANIADENTVPN